MTKYIAIGVGGMIGATLRFLISSLFEATSWTPFPWGTLFVNGSGAFILTFILFHPMITSKIHPTLITAITTGVIGSFTTFSTITVDIVLLWRDHTYIAILYLFLTLVGGLFCSYLGYRTSRRWNTT